LADDAGADLGGFDRVLISAPAPQAVPLLAAAPALAAQATRVRYAPCWTLMVGFAVPLLLQWDGLFVNSGPLGWVARNSAKPGRQLADGEVWVLNASPDWTRERLDADPEDVADGLLAAFAAIAGPLPAPAWRRAHRWLYALAEQTLEVDCLWDGALGIGACGDWCRGARVEGAWLSGEALAGRVLAGPNRAAGT
jgi:predicted NAD/FAD-dependent oxidoreductase